ncbi:hypothetical protein [Sediminicola luteus]|uniref:Uncharacterized protein n=1 Tax=Sediminicola luteus TaxID=319238 RepID=A0ABV2TU45_9FLAO
MKVYYVISIFLFSNFCNSQNPNIYLDKFLESKLTEIEKTWNERGYWGKGFENKDNRYNEAITFYLSIETEEISYYNSRIKKAILFSIENLQNKEGAFIQEGESSHIRTSLFLHGLAKVANKYPEIFNQEKIRISVNKAVKWLETPHKFSSNHNMASMLALKSLYNVTCNNSYLKLHHFYRNIILRDYNESGYWPEAPKDWNNTLNTPYLFVQHFLLEEYLLNNTDEHITKLKNNLSNFIYSKINLKTCSVDVRGSLGNFKKNNVENLRFSVASFFWSSEIFKKLSNHQRNSILEKCVNNFKLETEKAEILNNTDVFYRFGIIKPLIIKH